MKKLLIIGILFLLSGCDVFTEDPSLKESERIAIMTKVKTDSLTTAVELDNKVYLVKDNKVEKMTPKEDPGPVIFFFLGAITAGFIVGLICEKR